MRLRTSVVAPAFKWARISTKKDQVPIRTWSSPFEGLPMLETVVDRRDLLESIDEIHAFISCAYEIDPNWGGWTRAMIDAVLAATTPWVDLPAVRKRIESLRQGPTTSTTLALKPIAKLPTKRMAPAIR